MPAANQGTRPRQNNDLEILPETVRTFLARAQRSRSALLLDYDGTLAPFRVDRLAARPDPALLPALTALSRSARTRLMIVSGRPVAELEQLLPLQPLPEMWGVYGWEHRLAEGRRADFPVPADAQAALADEHVRLQAAGLGSRIERKHAGLALHWRGVNVATRRRLESLVGERWHRLAESHALRLSPFNGGLELIHPARNKGAVVRDVLAELGVEACIAYLGDDSTDEDAFRALDSRGLGVLVAERPQTTSAQVRLHPRVVKTFLEAWRQAVEAGDD